MFKIFILFINNYFYAWAGSFTPGEKAYIKVNGKAGGKIVIRVYKIEEPIKFFKEIKNPENVFPEKYLIKERGNLFKLMEKSIEETEKGLRGFFRETVKPEKRKETREFLGIKKAEEKKYEIPPPLKEFPLIEEWKINVKYGWIHENIELPELEKGVYLVEVFNRGNVCFVPLIISELRFIVKEDAKRVYVFVQELSDSKPVQNVDVYVFLNKEKEMKYKGKTDKNGMLSFEIEEKMGYKDYILVHKDKDVAFSRVYKAWHKPKENFVYIYTDRPLYRPGQKVYFKVILREKNKDKLKVPAGEINAKIINPKGNTIFDKELKLSKSGTANDSIMLPENTEIGTYRIKVQYKNKNFSGIFKVEEYRKPEFKVDVEVEPRIAIYGENVKIKVKAFYLFGSPVVNGKVSLKIARYPFEFYYSGRLYERKWRKEFIEEIKGETDKNGECTFEYKIPETKEKYFMYVFEAGVEDESGFEHYGKAKIKTGIRKYVITLKTSKWVYETNEDIVINVFVKTLENKPYDIGKVVIRIRGEKKVVKEYTINTEKGRGTLKIKLKEPGHYKIIGIIEDKKGILQSSRWIWVTKKGYYWFTYKRGGFQIIPDKEEYREGDKIKILIITPFEKGHLFYTLETEKVVKKGVIKIEGNTGFLDFKADKNFVPNFFINLFGNIEKNFYNQNKEIKVKSEYNKLKLEISLNKEKYRPRDTVEVIVKVKDHKGNPVQCELSLAVVDEAIFLLSPPLEKDIFSFFYPERRRYTSIASSLNFRFGSYGRKLYPPGEAFKSFELKEEALKATFKGEAEIKIREKFKDLALWKGRILTNNKGEARVKFTLPDNLTTWRIRVKACERSKFGESEKKFVVTKELIARLILPRFIRQRDTLLIKGIVHNYQEKEDKLNIKLEVENVVLLSDGDIKDVNILPGKSKFFDFKITAPKSGIAKFTFYAKGREKYDALKLELPVLPHGMERIISKSERLAEEREEFEFEIPYEAQKEAIYSALYLSPSYHSVVLSSLKELVGYPYGCVEQTMSKFLPDVAVKSVIEKAGIIDPLFEVELPKMIEKGLQRLYNFQHADGGWGWWKHDKTHPFNTTYVLYGLGILKNTGYKINEEVISKGLNRLKKYLREDKDKLSPEDKAFMIYTLSLYEKVTEDMITEYFDGDIDNPYTLALLSLAASRNGLRKKGSIYFASLKNMAKVVDGSVYFENERRVSRHGTIYSDPVIATSNAVLSFLEFEPDDKYLGGMLLYLIRKRRGAQWHSTIATSSSLISISEYMKEKGLFDFRCNVGVTINGKKIREFTLTKENIKDYTAPIVIPSEILRIGKNKVTFTKKGKGEILFSFWVKYYSREEHISPGGTEFEVKKEIWRLLPYKKDKKLVYKKVPFYGEVKKGDYLFVKIKVETRKKYEYFMIEDNLPAGCEVVKEKERFIIEGEKNYRGYSWYWRWNWSDEEIHDDRIAFFQTRINPGEHEYSYILRAYLPGKYHMMPCKASLMYFPDIFAHSEEYIIKITE